LTASAGFTFNPTGNVLTANGNINGSNFFTGGVVSAGGNVTGNIVLGANAVFGTSFVPVTGATITVNATNSIKLPVGNIAERPAGTPGMLRFNSQSNGLEVYDNTTWQPIGGTSFTVIGDNQFAGDGSTLTFTLSSTQTTNSCIVTINGVTQIPGTAYTVTGTALTFTEAPQAGDDIDVRTLTTTTSVVSISNSPANAIISVSDTSNIVLVTGQLSATGNMYAPNFVQSSDSRLKDNITQITNAGQVVNALQGVGYDWINGSGHAYGVIAQEVEKVVPEAVATNAEGMKSVNYSMLIPFLIETVKQLSQDVAELKGLIKK
jgi:hypothetical protein